MILVPKNKVIKLSLLNFTQTFEIRVFLNFPLSKDETDLTSLNNFREWGSAMFVDFSKQLHRFLNEKWVVGKDFVSGIQILHLEWKGCLSIKINLFLSISK